MRARSQAIPTDTLTVPPHIDNLFKANNTSQAPVQWVGRPIFQSSAVLWFIGLVLMPAVAVILPLVIVQTYLIGIMILPLVYSVVILAIAYGRTIPTYDQSAYILTADSAYIFTRACCGGLYMSNKFDILQGVMPTLTAVQADGIGNLVFGTALVRVKHGYRSVNIGFLGCRDASKVCQRVQQLRDEYTSRTGQQVIVTQLPMQMGMQGQGTMVMGQQGMIQQGMVPQYGMQQQQQVIQPTQPMFDPYTGKPLMPQFDPYTGKPIGQNPGNGMSSPPPYNPEGQASTSM
jgi:hypothetical protein